MCTKNQEYRVFHYTIVLLALFVAVNVAYCQDKMDTTEQQPWFSISGTASVTADFYDYMADSVGSQPGRRPANLTRFLFSPTLKFGSYLSLPLNFMFSFPETNVTTPTIGNPTIAQYLQNPANAFGLSSFSPKIGWAQFHLGAHTPQFSELSGGDQQLFGGGIDIKPGAFRIAASAGVAQRGVASDLAKGIQGAYRKDMYMARISLGNDDSTHFGINAVYAKDSKESITNNITRITPARRLDDSVTIIPADTVRLRAEEGIVATVNGKVLFTEGIELKMEGAVSSFTRDLSSAEQVIEGNPLNSLTSTRTSTRADLAGTAEFGIRMKSWGIKFTGLYMGAGFVPIGFPFQQSDRFDLKVSPFVRLFNGDLSINASLGNRVNNLSGTKGETLSQLIASANINANIIEEFSINGSYSNFGVRNNQTNDTLKIQNVSSSLSIDPTLTLVGESMTHIINAGFSLDQFQDFNVVDGAQSTNDTKTLLANYNLTLNEIGLNVGTSGSYMENALSTGTVIIRSVSINASYSLFKRTLVPLASFTVGSSTLGANPTDSQNFLNIGLRWTATKWLTLNTSYRANTFEYGNPLPRGRAFAEQIIQLSATSNF